MSTLFSFFLLALSFSAVSAAVYPFGVLNLTNWKLTTPLTDNDIARPTLDTYNVPPYFTPNKDNTGVLFRAYAGNYTSSSSKYPRSELREMTNGGTTKASWSTTSGKHVMEIYNAITHLPVAKPELVAGQIHDDQTYNIFFRVRNTTKGIILIAQSDGATIGTVKDDIQIGVPWRTRIESYGGRIYAYIDNVLKVNISHIASGCYFKAGNYLQSNVIDGKDLPDAYGEVVIYQLSVKHWTDAELASDTTQDGTVVPPTTTTTTASGATTTSSGAITSASSSATTNVSSESTSSIPITDVTTTGTPITDDDTSSSIRIVPSIIMLFVFYLLA